VAGSVRRKKAKVKDIEIVLITKVEEVPKAQLDLWGQHPTEPVPLVGRGINMMVEDNILRWDDQVVRCGVKYKRLIHCVSGMVIEFFSAGPDNWGLIYALRTGPGNFNQRLVSTKFLGGAMPHGMKMEGGFLWHLNSLLTTPTEREYFELLQVPHWPPEERTDQRLIDWLKRQPDTKWYPTEAARRLEAASPTPELA